MEKLHRNFLFAVRITVVIFLCTMLLYLLSLVCALPIAFGHPAFDGVIRPEGDGSFSAYMIPPYASNHASTIEVLPDGRLATSFLIGAVVLESPTFAGIFRLSVEVTSVCI